MAAASVLSNATIGAVQIINMSRDAKNPKRTFRFVSYLAQAL